MRSRLIRLANTSTIQVPLIAIYYHSYLNNFKKKAVHDLLSFRLSNILAEANEEWLSILSQNHSLWRNIDWPYRDNILTFLNEFQTRLKMVSSRQVVQSNSSLHYHTDSRLYFNNNHINPCNSETNFDFRHGSIGNFYLSGATQHFKSLENALEQMRFDFKKGLP